MKETVVTSAPRGITKQFLSATLLFHDFQENQETLEDMISLMTREGGTKEDVQKIMKDVQTEQKNYEVYVRRTYKLLNMIPSAKCVVPTAQITGRINEGRKKDVTN